MVRGYFYKYFYTTATCGTDTCSRDRCVTRGCQMSTAMEEKIIKSVTRLLTRGQGII